MSTHHSVLVIGGGTAGLSVAARLRNAGVADVAIVEPSEQHYYQPLWTLVGGGVFSREVTERPEADYIPAGATWIRDAATEFLPEKNTVKLASGAEVTYDQLVVAPGIQLDWNKIEGLPGNVGKGGICSNYSYETVNSTWETLQRFEGGNAIFTMPPVPIKCAGAPQKILYLADEALRKRGVRDNARLLYMAAGAGIFGVERYAATLRGIIARKDIDARFRQNLVAVRPAAKEAVFRHLDTGEETVLSYELLHVVPPQSAPDFIKRSPLADQAGWVEVDKHTLQHTRYPNVFSLGDASSLPTSRTGAAIRKEAPVLVANLLAFREGKPLAAKYEGYSSCPLVTGYGKLVLAEFDYDGKPAETFPVDQSKERYSMYVLKAHGLPRMYWHGMLRGRM